MSTQPVKVDEQTLALLRAFKRDPLFRGDVVCTDGTEPPTDIEQAWATKQAGGGESLVQQMRAAGLTDEQIVAEAMRMFGWDRGQAEMLLALEENPLGDVVIEDQPGQKARVQVRPYLRDGHPVAGYTREGVGRKLLDSVKDAFAFAPTLGGRYHPAEKSQEAVQHGLDLIDQVHRVPSLRQARLPKRETDFEPTGETKPLSEVAEGTWVRWQRHAYLVEYRDDYDATLVGIPPVEPGRLTWPEREHLQLKPTPPDVEILKPREGPRRIEFQIKPLKNMEGECTATRSGRWVTHHVYVAPDDVLTQLPLYASIHETGHMLDIEAFGRGEGFGSDHGDVGGVIGAIENSKAIAYLDGLSHRDEPIRWQPWEGPSVVVIPSVGLAGVLGYLRSRPEEFARAYTQWIAQKTGDEKLLRHIESRTPEHAMEGGALEVPWQWTQEDFAPIAAEFDKLFAENGLLREGKAQVHVRPYMREGHPVAGYIRTLTKWTKISDAFGRTRYEANGERDTFHIQHAGGAGEFPWKITIGAPYLDESGRGIAIGGASTLANAKIVAEEFNSGDWVRDRREMLQQLPKRISLSELFGGYPEILDPTVYEKHRAALLALHGSLPETSLRERDIKDILGQMIASASQRRGANPRAYERVQTQTSYAERLLSDGDAADYLQRISEAWGTALTPDDREALDYYRRVDGYDKINHALRADKLDNSVDVSKRPVDEGRRVRVSPSGQEGQVLRDDPHLEHVHVRLDATPNQPSHLALVPRAMVEDIPHQSKLVPMRDIVSRLDGMIDSSPKTDQALGLNLYRGIRDVEAVLGEHPTLGQRIHDPGYVSTTTEFDVAMGYSQGMLSTGRLEHPHPAVFNITTPAGAQGIWINASGTGASHNYEYVLPRGTTLEVVQIDTSGSEPVIELQVVPDVRHGGKAISFVPSVTPPVPFVEAEHPRGFHGQFIRKLSAEWRGAVATTFQLMKRRRWLGQKSFVDEALQHVVDQTNRGRRPMLVSPDEFERMLHDGESKLVSYHGTNRARYADDFLHGHFRVSLGTDGSGFYTATNPSFASGYATMKQEPGRLVRIAFKAGAHIADERMIEAEAKALNEKLLAGTDTTREPTTDAEWQRAAVAKTLIDNGRYAAWQGFDAIQIRNAAEGYEGDFFVILNRSALVADEQLYDPVATTREGKLVPWRE